VGQEGGIRLGIDTSNSIICSDCGLVKPSSCNVFDLLITLHP
jgi:hypothetical protein